MFCTFTILTYILYEIDLEILWIKEKLRCS